MTTFHYEQLTVGHLDEIEALQQIVVEGLEDQTVLQPLSRKEFENILEANGVMMGAFENEQLIACRALLRPDPNESEHLGEDAGVADLTRVIYQEVSFVHPQYRGFSLQRELGKRVMALVDLSAFDAICATVKPFNIPSLKDKFRQGMVAVALKEKYGGKLRYVFAKYLNEPCTFSEEEVAIEMADIAEQQRLFALDYVGVNLVQSENVWRIIYKKCLKR